MNKKIGFSLLELLIVLCIMGILTAIAIPNYSSYIMREKRYEAQAMLLRLSSGLENYYIQNNSYADATLEKLELTEKFSHDQYQLIISSLTDNSFIITAKPLGQQAERDTQCESFILNETNQRSISGTGDSKDCWSA
ncbi:MAG: type IV pilin protein [Gammaproteobacteria bacterium]|nr:type IV pilin protein [Gammaproteobacteria bacterium]